MRQVAGLFFVLISAVLAGCATIESRLTPKPVSISGVYPHLAMKNNHGECGTGAVVPWAGHLWVITYPPHYPKGSSDKLYQITPDLRQIIRPESVGGTHANRMIHKESQQLIIGPYFVDKQGKVRVVKPDVMPGRLTANARHLTDPANKVYFATMEEGLYEVDVNSLAVKCWINDGNKGVKKFDGAVDSKLPGYHGKGAYAGHYKLFYANNGEHGNNAKSDPTTPSGALAQWDETSKDWELLIREQFTEITGPGGIYGNTEKLDIFDELVSDEPVWSMGWDHKSVLLAVMEGQLPVEPYRLPKASFSYDGAHGWNTEWPRIREIGTGDDLLATMHGTFWHIPKQFSLNRNSGIKPRSNYLKVVGDFARWGDHVVLGCDDSAQKEFLNTRPTKAKHGAPTRSNSNLWFIKPERLSQLGPALGSGGVWLNEDLTDRYYSDKYLFAGYDRRMLHLAHRSDKPITVTIEVDREGTGKFELLRIVTVPANSYVPVLFTAEDAGQWVQMYPCGPARGLTAWFSYANDDNRTTTPDGMFTGLATQTTANDVGGLMRSLGGDDVPLGLIVQQHNSDEQPFYLLNEKLELVPSDDETRRDQTAKAASPDHDSIPLKIEGHSVLVEEDGKRYRLPLAPHRAADKPFAGDFGHIRRVREVATERDMVSIGGTFYELPARNAGGFAHVRPIASHPFRVHDFCSWRGLLLLTGVDSKAKGERIIRSADGKAAVWVGVIDDLWKLGKPVGIGGPWHKSKVKANEPSDPYLMYGYETKRLSIEADKPAEVFIQLDPSGTGDFHTLGSLIASPEKTRSFRFDPGVNAHWVRLVSDTDATITATFTYE